MACSTSLDSAYPSYCGETDHQGNKLCTIQPDPDIAGIGVLVAFIIIGITTILLMFILSLREISLDMFVNPTSMIDDDEFIDYHAAPKPRVSFSDARDFIETNSKPHTPTPLSTTIALLADTQFFMGIAIA